MARHKLVLIGAGSTVFTQRLVADLILSDDPSRWELALVDIDPEVLELVGLLVEKMIGARGADIPVTTTTNRREVLRGAGTVVTTIAVGGRRGWEADVRIPRQHGIFQPVGDTVMPGGISRALRMIPPMLDIARDVRELCPEADFYNYSNPMTAVCRAVRQATGVPVVGLCHGVHHVNHVYMPSFLGVEPGTITSYGIGLNHLTFYLDLRHRGQDAWPLVRAKLDEQRGSLAAEIAAKSVFPNLVTDRPPRYSDDPFAWGFFETYGAFPVMLDRHASEFFPERFPGGSYFGKKLGVDAFPIDLRIAQGDEMFDEMARLARSKDPLPDDFFDQVPGEHEELLDIIDSRLRDRRAVFSVNLPNQGSVPNLPADAVLEMPAAATASGFRQLHHGPLPDVLAAMLAKKLAGIELTVAAALQGSKPLFVEALLADGAVTDRGAAESLATDLIEAHRDHLPQFAA